MFQNEKHNHSPNFSLKQCNSFQGNLVLCVIWYQIQSTDSLFFHRVVCLLLTVPTICGWCPLWLTPSLSTSSTKSIARLLKSALTSRTTGKGLGVTIHMTLCIIPQLHTGILDCCHATLMLNGCYAYMCSPTLLPLTQPLKMFSSSCTCVIIHIILLNGCG